MYIITLILLKIFPDKIYLSYYNYLSKYFLKLPAETERVEYELEYGTNSIEVHKDAFGKGSKVLIVDDLLATGGTAKAMVELTNKLGAEVYELAFLIELEDLKGRDVLKGYDVYSQLKY